MPPRPSLALGLVALAFGSSLAQASTGFAYSGPADAVRVSESLPIADLAASAPAPDADRELRIVMRDAITLTDVEKQGIKGGGGVRSVNITTYGEVVLLIPLRDGQPDFSASTGEVRYLGSNRIGAKGSLQPHPREPLKIQGNRITGRLRLPLSIKEPSAEQPRETLLGITLDLTVSRETFGYTPDPDPSIPPWRSDKTRPAGYQLTGTWQTRELRNVGLMELSGRISGPAGASRLRATTGRFFPIQSIDLAATTGGLRVIAHGSSQRVEGHESQWAVLVLPAPLDLTRYNGLRLTVESDRAYAGENWPLSAAAAVSFRVKGEGWFSARSVTPLLGGRRSHIVDFALFARGSGNPGYGNGPNIKQFPDLSRIDAVAIGLANPFGVGTVDFTALALEAVRHAPLGAGEAPQATVAITIEPATRDVFNGTSTVPPGLFGYHLANSFIRKETDRPPGYFLAPPIDNDPHALLRLLRPGSLRPLDHTNFSAETGASMVRPLSIDYARSAEAVDGIMHTVTNENLWARPKWMDSDIPAYTEGIRQMFRQLGEAAWTPEKPDNTLRFIEFWNEPFMWARHINRGQSTLSAGPGDPGGNRGGKAWNDPTQFTFMPGKLGGEMYARFFNAAATGLRETNPHVKIGGMSSGVFGEDFFSQLTNYVAPFLEQSRDHIDFLTEHHYTTYPAAVAASYEVVTAWSLAKHGKRWPIWNTETNDLDDVAPGDRRSAEAAKAFTDFNRAYYNYRDILELIRHSRDKAAGRALHALWSGGWFKNDGEFLMYKHTADLRGTLVFTAADEPSLPVVAVNENGRIVLFALNDSSFPRKAVVRLRGAAAARLVEVNGLRLTPDESATAILPSPATARADRGDLLVTLAQPLASREILRIVVEGAPSISTTRATMQYFSDLVVAPLAPGGTLTGSITIPPGALKKARSATLRLVAGDSQTSEAEIRIGNTRVPIPATSAEGTHCEVVELPLDLATARLESALSDGRLPVTVTLAPGHDGMTLHMLSLQLTE